MVNRDGQQSSRSPTKALIVEQALAEGFALAGVAPASASPRQGYVRAWLAAGKHGQMAYLERNVEVRLDPTKFLEGAQTVICVADVYPSTATDSPSTDQPQGRIARFAWGDDYHRIIKKRLFQLADALRARWPEHQFRAAVDTAPLLEREHATHAGLGWIGKHTLLINRDKGSWLLLGQIVTTMELTGLVQEPVAAVDHCGTCRRCIDACPTGCISDEGYALDASRCISYLTIEHRDPIDPQLQAAMGNWIAGCDICQEVCPFNAPKAGKEPAAYQRGYATRPPGPTIDLLELLDWDTETRQAALQRSALKRIKLDMFKRNALIATGNYLAEHRNRSLQERVRIVAQDPQAAPIVRLTAGQVLAARNRATCD
jgi:epoxyqueuosine reductase